MWKSLYSVIIVIGLFKIDVPEADLKYSILNRKYSIIIERAGGRSSR
ncbi:hypothetical protein D1BOALGB6SA_4382 [Olavius sp. associated proteobacterium Delta 1]|nr:hypothetical protein D1BOALGB6SA_4382 [Olavius sp. associated proteobacterium Delta 1]